MTGLDTLSIQIGELTQQRSGEKTGVWVSGTVECHAEHCHGLQVEAQLGNAVQSCSFQTSDDGRVATWWCGFEVDGEVRQQMSLCVVASTTHYIAVERRELLLNEVSNDGVQGGLDLPSPGLELRGDVLTVMGWCVMEGSAVSQVDVVVNGALTGRARTFLERPDVAEIYPNRDAPVAGFQAFIPVADWPLDLPFDVSVIATSLDGRRWYSNTSTVTRIDDRPIPSIPPRSQRLETRRQSLVASATPPLQERRVAVVTHDLGYGGGQLWLSEMLRQFRLENRFHFDVIALTDGPLRQLLEESGVFVHVTSPAAISGPGAHAGRVAEWALLLRSLGADAVMANTIIPFQAVEAAHELGLPVVWAIHESFPLPVYCQLVWGGGIHPYVEERFGASFGLANALIFEAEQTAALFSRYSSPTSRHVLDYGVDVGEIDAYRAGLDRAGARAALGWTDDDVVLLVVGVFEGRKAQAAIVAAFDELSSLHERARLVMVGSHSSPYCDAVEEQVRRLTREGRVHLVPVTPDIHHWYAIADILVCGSDIESLPRSILEAMAFELPVVSTDVFGVATLIDDGRTGWLTTSHDLQGLIATIDRVLRLSQSERSSVAAAARLEVERRSGERSYGIVLANALDALIDDPAANLLPILTDRVATTRTGQ